MKHQPIVEELIRILEVKPELKEALEESIREAERLDAPTLTAYYEFLDEMVTMITAQVGTQYNQGKMIATAVR